MWEAIVQTRGGYTKVIHTQTHSVMCMCMYMCKEEKAKGNGLHITRDKETIKSNCMRV